ncbi:hypothetical protein CBER1_06003 [Cercospora berteroae]|uniref:Transmembrane protein n=1 Tax=Cercospora berteroae TaxID=357750 RepID=A0A2S6C4L4_9PEZI|nr:hypothetical protein CBER1_06003 [Cercospora berteroae]
MAVSPIAYIRRAVGVETINTFCRHLSGFRKAEKPKVVLHKSFGIAWSRSAVHILPLSIFAILIYINYTTLYIGPSFQASGQDDEVFVAAIQVAAKAQELLCVASRAAIVLQALRRELLGDGIPIGRRGAGICFKNIHRCRFYALLVIAGGLAAVIGPASAVLMLPRQQNLPTAPASFYLNGAMEEVFPNVASSNSELAICNLPNATSYAVCPSGGYESLLHNFKTSVRNHTNMCGNNHGQRTGQQWIPECQAKGVVGWRMWKNMMVTSPHNLTPAVLSSILMMGDSVPKVQTVVTQPHAATVIATRRLVREYTERVDEGSPNLWSDYKWSYDLTTSGSATNPWARVRCTVGRNFTANACETGFPYLYRSGETYTAFKAKDYRFANIAALERNISDHLRTQWVSLPAEEFGGVEAGLTTAGLLVELPWTNDETRVAFGCAIATSWHNNTVTSDRSANYNAYSALITDSLPTNRPFTLDPSWLKLLTPKLPVRSGGEESTLNTLESIFTEVGIAGVVPTMRTQPSIYWDVKTKRCVYGMRESSDETDTQLWNADDCGNGAREYVQLILASVIADGLSRFGSHHRPKTHKDFPSQWLSIYAIGWAFHASKTTDYLALGVVCICMALATAHIFWLLYWGDWVSSGAWDTVTELLVLCQNSPPSVPSGLENTSAGLHRLGTYAKLVKVRARNEDGESHEDNRAKLVLVEDNSAVRENEAYATVKPALLKVMPCATVAACTSRESLPKTANSLERVKYNVKCS